MPTFSPTIAFCAMRPKPFLEMFNKIIRVFAQMLRAAEACGAFL